MKGRRLPKILPPWREVMETAEFESWFPLLFNRRDPAHAAAMDELKDSGLVSLTYDTISAQIADLIKSRNPPINPSPEQLAARVEDHLEGTPLHDYGRWAYFPWSRRMVHLLPPNEFWEVRTDRNRNKLTRAEQTKLSRLKIALAGLSVGNAIATTLALEGVFGELRMADFDTLDLSNMNRIRSAVHDIGINKAVMCARQIFEQNPYANLVLYTDGITADNVGEFMDGYDGSGRADLVLDECDNMFIKVKLREEARARKIPVVMETSDRGMLDIERFDLEPNRPILHGLLGELTADDITRLPPESRLQIILEIIGTETMSARLSASMLEFGRTLRGLSQLGSDVTLGGATTATVIRRFGLGQPLASGRVFVDVGAMLNEIRSPEASRVGEAETQFRREILKVRDLIEAAVWAPSDGNRQPWKFVYRQRDHALAVYHDVSRSGGPNDELGRQMALIAIGAAIENICIVAAGSQHRSASVELLPSATDPTWIADLRFTERNSEPSNDPLVVQIPRRQTNRRIGTRAHLSPAHGQVLTAAARDNGTRLQLCTTSDMLAEIGQILGEAERLRLLSSFLHKDLMDSLRWTATEVDETRDGIFLDTYVSGPGESATFKLIRSPHVTKLLRDVNAGTGLAAGLAQTVASSAAIGLLTIPGTDAAALVRGGRAMQQVWLTANALGLALHPINNLVGMMARVERYQGMGLSKQEIGAIVDLRERFTQFFNVSMNDAEILMFRLFHAERAADRTLRRSIDDVFSVLQDTVSSTRAT